MTLPFTPTTLNDGPTTRDAAYWYATVVKPTSDAVMQVLGDADWTTLPTLNGWSPYGWPYKPPQFRMFDKRVQMRGLVSNGSTGSTNPVCVLPSYARPLKNKFLPGISSVGGAIWGVLPTGEVYVSSYVGGGTNPYVALGNINFWTD